MNLVLSRGSDRPLQILLIKRARELSLYGVIHPSRLRVEELRPRI